MKKVLCLVMLVTLVGWAAAGNGFMTDGGSWDVATNWSAGVVPQDSTTDPGSATPQWNNDAEIRNGNTALIDSATAATTYEAREEPIPGVTGESVAIAAGNAGVAAEWISDLAALHPALTELVQAGDVVLTLGAGDITKVGPQLLSAMQGTAA